MDTTYFHKNANFLFFLCALALLTLTRLLPHPPNTAPIFCAALALAYFLPKNQTALVGLIAFILSDILLSFINHYPAFGLWSFFTYSGFMVGMFLATACLTTTISLPRTFYAVLIFTVFFWVWTNLGAWLTTALYPKTLLGLGACFIAGIPFLNNSLLGNLAWGIVIFCTFCFK